MPQQTKILVSHYDYEKVFNFLIKQGKHDFGSSFTILATDKAIIMKLLAYFLRDEFMCNEYQIALNKGILLSGPIGCGKTTLMHLMKYLNNQNQSIYLIKSCRDVSFEFIKDGYDVVHRYTRQSFYKNGSNETPKHYCFDDLGTENNLKFYGNECNIMAEILLSRYDLFINRKLITHLTTNLAASEIEVFYGNRLRSRMRELFNLIPFDNATLDKRK
jgi:energy-coupling factor transporter ATP-binding protein EcfA2